MDKLMMDWSSTVVGTYGKGIEVTEDDINTVICTALEGGIGYWACLDNTTVEWKDRDTSSYLSDWATKIILDGEALILIDEEDENRYELTLDKLLNGLSINAERRDWDADIDNFDADSCDCVIQYAIFEKLVYG